MSEITVVSLGADGQLTSETTPDTTAAPVSQETARDATPAPAPAPDPDPTPPAVPIPPDVAPAVPAPADDDNETESTGAEEEAPASRPQPSSVNRAMARLRRESSEAQQRAAAAEERARMLEAGYTAPAAPRPEPAAPQGPPQQQEFATDPEWYQALARWEAGQAVEAYKREQLEARAVQAQVTRDQALAARQDAFRQQHPDYDAVLADQLTGRMSPQLFGHLLDDDDGPALAYLLAHEPAEVQRLNALDERALARALGRLAARLPGTNGVTTPPTPPVTPKPPPLTPVSGAGSGAPTTYRDDMSQAEFDRLSPYRPQRR